MRRPVYVWSIAIGGKSVAVFAKNFGSACRASRRLGVQLITDHDTGGFKNAFGSVVRLKRT